MTLPLQAIVVQIAAETEAEIVAAIAVDAVAVRAAEEAADVIAVVAAEVGTVATAATVVGAGAVAKPKSSPQRHRGTEKIEICLHQAASNRGLSVSLC